MQGLLCLQWSCLRILAWESSHPPPHRAALSHRFLSALKVPEPCGGESKPRHSPSTTEGYSLSLSLFNISSFWNILSGSVGTARRCLSKRHLFQCFTDFASRLPPLASLNTGLLGDGRSRESDGRGWPTPRAPSAAGQPRAGAAEPGSPRRGRFSPARSPGPLRVLLVRITELHISFASPEKGASYST